MVDRFHSGNDLSVSEEVLRPSQHELMQRNGGTLQGIRRQLPYIQGLGCTAIWLSPVMENPEHVYHGYAIQDFYQVDPRLGSLQDLQLLVLEAHALGIKVYLDIVLNHTASVWEYSEEHPEYDGHTKAWKDWTSEHYPRPYSLRNPDFFVRKGRIKNWDHYPETREGDIFELKKLKTDASPEGWQVRKELLSIYTWWLEQTKADGFRIDTIKHLSPGFVTWFCHSLRNQVSASHPNLICFGEAIGSYSLFSHYCKCRPVGGVIQRGLDRLLDFPLHFLLPSVFSGERSPSDLWALLLERQRFFARHQLPESSLIGFLDNHDQVAQVLKKRIHAQLTAGSVLHAYALLHFICPVVQLYYGTEQGLAGQGTHDVCLREPMFDRTFMLHLEGERYKDFQDIHRWKQRHAAFFTGFAEISMLPAGLRLLRRSGRRCLVLELSAGISEQELTSGEMVWPQIPSSETTQSLHVRIYLLSEE
ncbi:MAG: alpha-amylase family glycosyl hydrolase [Cytophagaceae bacterium]|jgi:alpha-amylase|nr:alpha-amylase family glycosyl hydrolase [Cytophagaceae bacterium]